MMKQGQRGGESLAQLLFSALSETEKKLWTPQRKPKGHAGFSCCIHLIWCFGILIIWGSFKSVCVSKTAFEKEKVNRWHSLGERWSSARWHNRTACVCWTRPAPDNPPEDVVGTNTTLFLAENTLDFSAVARGDRGKVQMSSMRDTLTGLWRLICRFQNISNIKLVGSPTNHKLAKSHWPSAHRATK